MEFNYGFQNYPEHIQRELVIPNLSMPELLKNSVDLYGNHEALTFYGRVMTYKELSFAVRAFAASLKKQGFKKGERFAIMLPNCPQFVIAYYGILTVGGIVTQVNPMLVERELQYILKDSGSNGIIVLDTLYPRVQAVQDNTDLTTVISVSFAEDKESVLAQGESGYSAIPFTRFIQDGMETSAAVQPDVAVVAEDVALLQYTGGTTGRAKGAMLTHRNLIANVLQTYEFFKDDVTLGQERSLTVIPLFHVFGMTSCMNYSLYTGACMVLLPRFDVEEVLKTIQQEKPTMFPGVPTMYVALTHYPDIESYGVNSIHTCNSGSAPMPVNLLRQFESKTNAQVLEGYGLSEASPTTHCNPPFATRKPGSVGIGIPSTEYRIVDVMEGQTEVPVGEQGELVIRGPQVMKGYWKLPDETANTLRNGWLHTGDIAQMDEDGYVYIVDRKKDLIIASGYNIYPREVEEIIYEHPDVKEAAVVGANDDYRGETVKAYIVLKEGATVTTDDITVFCKENLAPYKVPKIMEFRDELPKSTVGKVLRRVLREEG